METSAIATEDFFIKTEDEYFISATRFRPEQENGNVVLICSATGVKQYFYYNFAQCLCEQGFTVITFDYRGIGKSKSGKIRGFHASLVDWACKDFKGVSDFINREYPGYKKHLIGHSIGGVFIGLSDACTSFDSIITICAQVGYWKYFDNDRKLLVLWFFHIVIPVVTKTFGYFPSWVKKLGDPLPVGVMKDWRTLGLNPKSQLALADITGNYYYNIHKPVLAISVEDDKIASKKAVDKFADLLKNAKIHRKHILVSESGFSSVGHLNFFRKKHSDTLWKIAFNWLSTQ